jgi:hypothetical protein
MATIGCQLDGQREQKISCKIYFSGLLFAQTGAPDCDNDSLHVISMIQLAKKLSVGKFQIVSPPFLAVKSFFSLL